MEAKWRAIETAPKDGTEIKVRGRDWGSGENRYHYANVRWRVANEPTKSTQPGWRSDHHVPGQDYAMVYLTDWKPS